MKDTEGGDSSSWRGYRREQAGRQREMVCRQKDREKRRGDGENMMGVEQEGDVRRSIVSWSGVRHLGLVERE